MKVKKTMLGLLAGWACLQTAVALAATSAASVTSGEDERIDTRISFLTRSLSDEAIDTRLYLRIWSAESGARIDTLTPNGTVFLIR